MKITLFLFLVSSVFLFNSCINEPEILTTSVDVLKMNTVNAEQALSISSNLAWNAKSSDKWCTLSDSVGKGDKDIKVLCKNNYDGLERKTTITINFGKQSKSINVYQSGGIVLLNENFDNNFNNWIAPLDSVSEKINNGMFNINNTGTYFQYFIGTKSLIKEYTGNYVIIMRYNHVLGTAPFGLTFANKDRNNFYLFLLQPQGWYFLNNIENGILTRIFNYPSNAVVVYNTICLLKTGSTCDIYVNDRKLNTFYLSAPHGSYVGFYSFPKSEVNVDYLKIIQI
jgi:hypothetical protein